MGELRGTIEEFFRLRRAGEAAGRLSDSAREAVRAKLLLGQQRMSAAVLLWGGEHRAEGLRLARDGLYVLLEGADLVGAAQSKRAADASDEPAGEKGQWPEALAAFGAPQDDTRRVNAAREGIERTSLPLLESDVTTAHEELYGAVSSGGAALRHTLELATRTPARLRRLSFWRRAGAIVLGTLLVGGLGWALYPHERYTATASVFLAEHGGFPPSRAVDGDATTEWLMPDGRSGYLDVAINHPRELRAVRIANARNAPFFNVATRDFRVEAYAGDRLVGSARGTFSQIERGSPEWRTVPLRASGVTRVRIYSDTYHSAAGGIAEVAFE